MNRASSAVLASGLTLLCGLISTAWADASAHIDASHHELNFEHPPQRIVSLVPALTETVCELQECERLVAVDRYSNWPDSVAHLPKAGGFEDVQIESVIAARPDVVLLGSGARVVGRLREAGVVALEFRTETYEDIAHNVKMLGELLGVPDRAQRLNRQIEQSVSEAVNRARAGLAGRKPLVYYEVSSDPYAAGPQSFIGVMLARVGVRNIVTADLGPFPKLNPEYVVRANPDVILIAPAEAPHLAGRPGWDQIRAVREGRICSFASGVRDVIVRPGPRVGEGLSALTQCVVRVAP